MNLNDLQDQLEENNQKANEILKYQPDFLKKSVLSESQIKKIAQFHHGSSC